MKIAVSGASGMIGRPLCKLLESEGHTAMPLVRGTHWDPAAEQMDASALNGVDAVVHLAGENLNASRWTDAFKRQCMDSRVKSTRLLARTIAAMPVKPRVFVSASATGYYGDRGEDTVDETSGPGRGFLSEICQAWEGASASAGTRTVNTRIGVVMHPSGSALKEMLGPAKMGISSRFGSGQQWFPWVGLDDVIRALSFAVTNETLQGPINLVSPNGVRQKEAVTALAKALHRPALGFVPRAMVQLMLGKEKADELLFFSTHVKPTRLEAAGFQWKYPALDRMFHDFFSRS